VSKQRTDYQNGFEDALDRGMVNFASAPNKGEYMRGFRDGEKSLKDGTGMADPQAEIAMLRNYVGNNYLRSDYQNADQMRAEIAALREQVQTLRVAFAALSVSPKIDDAPSHYNHDEAWSWCCGWEAAHLRVQAILSTPTTPEANP